MVYCTWTTLLVYSALSLFCADGLIERGFVSFSSPSRIIILNSSLMFLQKINGDRILVCSREHLRDYRIRSEIDLMLGSDGSVINPTSYGKREIDMWCHCNIKELTGRCPDLASVFKLKLELLRCSWCCHNIAWCSPNYGIWGMVYHVSPNYFDWFNSSNYCLVQILMLASLNCRKNFFSLNTTFKFLIL